MAGTCSAVLPMGWCRQPMVRTFQGSWAGRLSCTGLPVRGSWGVCHRSCRCACAAACACPRPLLMPGEVRQTVRRFLLVPVEREIRPCFQRERARDGQGPWRPWKPPFPLISKSAHPDPNPMQCVRHLCRLPYCSKTLPDSDTCTISQGGGRGGDMQGSRAVGIMADTCGGPCAHRRPKF